MSVRKKLPYILIPLASLAIIAVAALTANRYPDTAEFPRIPMGSGTVGEAIAKILGVSTLENYNGDGTVENTEKFDGRTATGYLRSNPICPASQVWLGIEANGTPKCGTKSSTPLAYAQITDLSGNGTVYRTDGTSVPLVNNMQLYAGDIVKTNPSSNTTLTFPDSSLLRLDSDTTVSFDLVFVQPSNQTMASAILASGQLWGRILTQSGSYAIGTDDLVAGVRGTSIALQKTAASNITNDAGIWKVTSSESPTALTVVDSKIPTGQEIVTLYGKKMQRIDGITIKTKGTRIVKDAQLQIRSDKNGYKIYEVTENSDNTIKTTQKEAPPVVENTWLYDIGTSEWARKNTLADIAYMNKLLLTRANDTVSKELQITEPVNPADPKAPILCNDPNTTFWKGMTATEAICQPNNVVAYFDCRNGDNNLYIKNADNTIGTGTYTRVQQVTCGGNYMLSQAQSNQLKGKKVITDKFTTPTSGNNQYIIGALLTDADTSNNFVRAFFKVGANFQSYQTGGDTFPNLGTNNEFQIGYLKDNITGDRRILQSLGTITFTN